MTERYRAERYAGAWQVVDDTTGSVVDIYGAGAAGAEAAAVAARALEHASKAGQSPVRTWRKARKLTQTQLAERLGVRLLTVQRWEAGLYQPPPFLDRALRDLDRELSAQGAGSAAPTGA